MNKTNRLNAFRLKFTRERCILLLKAALFALLPLIGAAAAAASQGHTLGEVYLPSSEWNDELFYYKQVEGILRYGYPYGYFGFNESQPLLLSFAAWSPVLIFPWLLFGLVCGWGLLSPIICNLLLLGWALFCFVLLTRPSAKQLLLLGMLFLLFTPFARYLLSGMPEVICFSLVIIFYGLAERYGKTPKVWCLALLFVLSALLTLMRPYMALFMLLPCYYWVRRKRWRGAAGSVAVLGGTVLLYALIKKYLCTPYFTPLFDTSWVSVFFNQGIWAGLRHMAGELLAQGKVFAANVTEGFLSGWTTGAYCAGFFVVLAVLAVQTLADVAHKRREKAVLHGHLTLCFFGMLGALLLMYNKMGMEPGSKHLLIFMAVGIFAVGLMDTRFCRKAVLVGAVFAWLYVWKASDPYTCEIPVMAQEKAGEQEYWREVFSEKLMLDSSRRISFSNVVIWTFQDETDEGAELFDWQILYALPPGFGISCCQPEYVLENFEELKSRYVAAPAGGEVDAACRKAGFEEIGRYGAAVMYDRGTGEAPGGSGL